MRIQRVGLLLAAIFCLSQQSLSYNGQIGFKALHLSAAAYCSYESVQSWTCGKACTNYGRDLSYSIKLIKDWTKHTFAFAAYDDYEDMIVLSFRGTNDNFFLNWENQENWSTNLNSGQVYHFQSGGYVHEGYSIVYKNLNTNGLGTTIDQMKK